MTSYEGKYDKFKVSLSLGTDKLYISALDEVTYDFYDLDVTNMVFNNPHIKLSQLFHIIKKGLEKKDENIFFSLEQANKLVKLRYKIENDYFSLDQTFELAKQLTETTGTKELKKELFELKKAHELLKKEVQQKAFDSNTKHESYKQDIYKSISTLESKQDSVNKHELLKKDILGLKKNIKENSIIPLINLTIDENQVETSFKWFLDWLKTQINPSAPIAELYTPKHIQHQNIGTGGQHTFHNLGWHNTHMGNNCHTNQNFGKSIPDKSLYYYLRKRNIEIWKDHSNNMYWNYTI